MPYALAALILMSVWPLTAAAQHGPDAKIERISEQIAENPNDSSLWIKRGDWRRQQQEFSAADRDFHQARALDPNHPVLSFYQGRLALEVGDPLIAEFWLGRYLARHANDSIAWQMRGEANIALGQPEAAAEYFAEAIRVADRPSTYLSK